MQKYVRTQLWRQSVYVTRVGTVLVLVSSNTIENAVASRTGSRNGTVSALLTSQYLDPGQWAALISASVPPTWSRTCETVSTSSAKRAWRRPDLSGCPTGSAAAALPGRDGPCKLSRDDIPSIDTAPMPSPPPPPSFRPGEPPGSVELRLGRRRGGVCGYIASEVSKMRRGSRMRPMRLRVSCRTRPLKT
eukprot:359194-Chlamydomonas_euryale.AAC.6